MRFRKQLQARKIKGIFFSISSARSVLLRLQFAQYANEVARLKKNRSAFDPVRVNVLGGQVLWLSF
jgi:hypothetical protein